MIGQQFGIQNQNRPADKWLSEVVRWTWKVKLYTHLETDLLGELRDGAETEAINVFAHNLHDLLLAAPAGPRATLGLDPGLRTGCKVAVVDSTGKLLDFTLAGQGRSNVRQWGQITAGAHRAFFRDQRQHVVFKERMQALQQLHTHSGNTVAQRL